jgi:phosphoglycolate phosphatase-like HAD superfamily hydrolase
MVGDSAHDMVFGKEAGMQTVGVGPKLEDGTPQTDFIVPDLAALANLLTGTEE